MNIRKIEPLEKIKRRKRVCAYARVSLDKEAMMHSLVFQISHYTKVIKSNSKWEYAGVYSDEGITGTKANRPGFQKMVEDAKVHKFDLVLVKSVSRFARNTIDLLTTCRLFKELGIDVFFEEQNIHTLSYEGELMLSLYASFAQEESRSMSENIKWKIRKDMQEGKPPYSRALGYEKKNRKVRIIPAEAAVVKLIFALYLKGNGELLLARYLNKHGYKTINGSSYRVNSVSQILTNSNYTGDLLLQKTYRQNHMTKKKMKNKGELTQYLVHGNHPAIVSREDFDEVQKRLSKNCVRFKISTKKDTYPFSHMIKCVDCNGSYRRRKSNGKVYYQCGNKINAVGIQCHNQQIPESELYRMATEALELKEFNEGKFKEKIDFLVALFNQKVEFHFKDGRTVVKEWNFKSRSESWTEEMKEKARINGAKAMKGEKHEHRSYPTKNPQGHKTIASSC